MEPKKQTCKNDFGITVVKCCASCKHKSLDRDMRLCTKGEGHVRANYLCPEWIMNPNLRMAGKGGGQVQKRSYQKFLCEYPQPEDNIKRVPNALIRLEYEKLYGSAYINI